MRRLTVLMIATLALAAAGCGGDDDGADGAATATDADGGTDGADEEPDPGAAAGGDGEAGSLTLDGETIAFDSSRCFLEEQEAAAGGGTIELTGQAFGTDAAGEELSIDVTRFSEESDFAGDSVEVVMGDPRSGEATSLIGQLDLGAVSLDGSVLSATGITLEDFEAQSQVTASFEINC